MGWGGEKVLNIEKQTKKRNITTVRRPKSFYVLRLMALSLKRPVNRERLQVNFMAAGKSHKTTLQPILGVKERVLIAQASLRKGVLFLRLQKDDSDTEKDRFR